MIHLDHLTTTPPLPEVIDAMRPWHESHFGAASSLHQLGLEARDALTKEVEVEVEKGVAERRRLEQVHASPGAFYNSLPTE